MKTLFDQIAPSLPAGYQRNATPIIVVGPKGVGKSVILTAFSNLLQQWRLKLNLGPVVWSKAIVPQWTGMAVHQRGTTPTPGVDNSEVEYVCFHLNGQAFVMIAVAGEDLMADGVDPLRVAGLLRDAIVVFAFHPLLALVDEKATPAQFAVRSLAYQISFSFNMSAAEAFEIALHLMLCFDLSPGFNPDYDELKPIIEAASFEYKPTGTTPESRFPLICAGENQDRLDQCELALTEVIESVVRERLPAQRQIEDALAGHPRVIRKPVRRDLLDLAPGHGVYPDDILRQRLGPATRQITAGGADVRSRLQRNRPGLIVIEGPHTHGPEQLLKAVEEMVARDRSLLPHRQRQAKVAACVAGLSAIVLILAERAFGIVPTLALVGGAATAIGAGLAAWLWLRLLPRRTRRTKPAAKPVTQATTVPVMPTSAHGSATEARTNPPKLEPVTAGDGRPHKPRAAR